MKESVAENPQDSCCSLLMTFYVSTSLIFTLSCVNFDWLMTNNTALHSFVRLFVCLFVWQDRARGAGVSGRPGRNAGRWLHRLRWQWERRQNGRGGSPSADSVSPTADDTNTPLFMPPPRVEWCIAALHNYRLGRFATETNQNWLAFLSLFLWQSLCNGFFSVLSTFIDEISFSQVQQLQIKMMNSIDSSALCQSI